MYFSYFDGVFLSSFSKNPLHTHGRERYGIYIERATPPTRPFYGKSHLKIRDSHSKSEKKKNKER